MAQLGLSNHANRLPYQLSGGMQQRVAMGRAFAQSPDLLLMDEPFGALDAMTRQGAQSVLLQIYAERQCTIAFVTHDVEEALMLSDRIAILTERPGHVAEIIKVPFVRPRIAELQWEPEFIALRREIMCRLRNNGMT